MSDKATTHLQSKAAAQLSLSDEERIQIIRQGSYIELPRFAKTGKLLQALLDFPVVTRPKALLIVAPPNNGKSTILERFLRQSNPSEDLRRETSALRVLMINAPPAGDRLGFYQRILDATFTVYNPKSSWTTLRSQVVRLCRQHGIKVLLLDELHDVLAGTTNQQNLFNIELKQFMNETKVSIAAAGLEKAPALFLRDPQLTSRFEKFDLDPFQPDEELGMLLASIERRLPLRDASNLKDPRIVAEVSRRAEGAIGDIYSLLSHCAIEAIEKKTRPERITLTALRNADWQRPTQRTAFTRQARTRVAAENQAADEAFARELDGRADEAHSSTTDSQNEGREAPVAKPAPKLSTAKVPSGKTSTKGDGSVPTAKKKRSAKPKKDAIAKTR